MTLIPNPQPEDKTGISPVPNYPQGSVPVWPTSPASVPDYHNYPPPWQQHPWNPQGTQYQPPPVQLNVQQHNTQPSIAVKRDIGAMWHLVHLTLTILTVGFWAPVWIVHAIVGRRARR